MQDPLPSPAPSDTPSSETPESPAATPPANEPSGPTPGYFNQAQLDEIKLAEDVLAAAQNTDHAPRLESQDVTADYLAKFAARLKEARARMSATGQSRDEAHAATQHATGTELALVEALQGIQSAARQKARMSQDDDDPTGEFTTDGYLIGTRLNPNRAGLLQNAETLIAKATQDQLPGYKPAAIEGVEDALKAYREDKTEQGGAQKDQESTRLERDALMRRLISRRLAIQHAADRTWPYTKPANRPVRKLFGLPLNRPMSK